MSKEPQPSRSPVQNCALRVCQPTVTFPDGTVRFVEALSPRRYSATLPANDQTCLGHYAVKKFYDLAAELRELAQNPLIGMNATNTSAICTAFFCKQNTGRITPADIESFHSITEV